MKVRAFNRWLVVLLPDAGSLQTACLIGRSACGRSLTEPGADLAAAETSHWMLAGAQHEPGW